jgi:hypothetical protein
MQSRDQAAIVYHLKFTAELGVQTQVIFPMPTDATENTLMSSLTVNEDGGTLGWFMTREGEGIGISGNGSISADMTLSAVSGFDPGSGAPDASLSMQVPDAGPYDYYLVVNKGGGAPAEVEFEYTATRNCGNGCGGKRSWKFSGSAGVGGPAAVTMDFVEEN